MTATADGLKDPTKSAVWRIQPTGAQKTIAAISKPARA
jgi:hypothetical protein